MKVELNRDVEHLLTRGDAYEAERVDGGYRIHIRTDMIVPAEFAREIEFKIGDVVLREDAIYDLTVRPYGRTKKSLRLNGWRLSSIKENGWRLGFRVRFLKDGSRWGAVSREVENDRIESIVEVEPNTSANSDDSKG